MEKSAVLFDLDGVTIDTEPLYTLSEIRLFKEYGIDIPKEDWPLFRGCSEEAFFDLSMERYNIVEDKNKSFYKTLEQIKIFVSDHLGTTFLEAMQANIPTIIFINKTSYMFRDSFQKYIDKFIQEKILRNYLPINPISPNKLFKFILKFLRFKSYLFLLKNGEKIVCV